MYDFYIISYCGIGVSMTIGDYFINTVTNEMYRIVGPNYQYKTQSWLDDEPFIQPIDYVFAMVITKNYQCRPLTALEILLYDV